MIPNPHLTWDFSQLWIAVLVIGAMWVAWWFLGRKK